MCTLLLKVAIFTKAMNFKVSLLVSRNKIILIYNEESSKSDFVCCEIKGWFYSLNCQPPSICEQDILLRGASP